MKSSQSTVSTKTCTQMTKSHNMKTKLLTTLLESSQHFHSPHPLLFTPKQCLHTFHPNTILRLLFTESSKTFVCRVLATLAGFTISTQYKVSNRNDRNSPLIPIGTKLGTTWTKSSKNHWFHPIPLQFTLKQCYPNLCECKILIPSMPSITNIPRKELWHPTVALKILWEDLEEIAKVDGDCNCQHYEICLVFKF